MDVSVLRKRGVTGVLTDKKRWVPGRTVDATMAIRLATSSVFNKSFLSRRGSVNLVPEKFACVVVSRMYLTGYGRL